MQTGAALRSLPANLEESLFDRISFQLQGIPSKAPDAELKLL